MPRPTTYFVLGSALVLSTAAYGQQAASKGKYRVNHSFEITTAGNLPPEVFLVYRTFTLARTNKCRDGLTLKAEIPIGPGLTTVNNSAAAPDSTATAIAEANILQLGPGIVAGTVEARGNVSAAVTGCPPPGPPRGSGYANSESRAMVVARGRKADRKGNIVYVGDWENSKIVGGSTDRGLIIDPITSKLTDKTTGLVEENTLLAIKSVVANGTTKWTGGKLTNDADFMTFEVQMSSPVTAKQGTILIHVDYNVVIESEATGAFANLAMPVIGEPGDFSLDLPPISMDYDLGGDPNDDLEVEFGFAGAGEAAAAENGLDVNGSYLTDIGVRTDGASVCVVNPFEQSAWEANVQQFHVADDFVVPEGETAALDALYWPVFVVNAPADQPLKGAFVEIWNGEPGEGGEPIAGDMETNRLLATDFTNVYHVQKDLNDASRAIKNAVVDMSWAPPLEPGHYWLRFAAIGPDGVQGGQLFAPTNRWEDEQYDNALQYIVADNIWVPTDADFPFILFSEAGASCYPDFTGEGQLDLFDFLAFVNVFNAKDPAADCVADGALDLFDFLCFVNAFNAGC